MAISSLNVFNGRGRLLIGRCYRGDNNEKYIEEFPLLLADNEESYDSKPIMRFGNSTLCYIKCNALYVVASTSSNCNVSLTFAFLYKFVTMMKKYFDEVGEESIRDNFVFLYELLDEVLDFGYPQTTEARILQDYITQERREYTRSPSVPVAVTNAVSWRPTALRYDKNEVFLDVVESVNMIMSNKGNVIRSEVLGVVNMRVYLSGMPELRLGLNDNFSASQQDHPQESAGVKLDDVKFHQCVRLARFEADGTIAFIPPDGAFELMSYRLDTSIKPLIQVQCDIETFGRSRVIYRVRARCNIKARSTANGVQIAVPSASDAYSPAVTSTAGTVRYSPEKGGLIWLIKSFPGGKEYSMTAELRLPSVQSQEPHSNPPITVQFEIPYFTTSGLQIRHLKLSEKSGYTALPWVRYITRNGDYMVRA